MCKVFLKIPLNILKISPSQECPERRTDGCSYEQQTDGQQENIMRAPHCIKRQMGIIEVGIYNHIEIQCYILYVTKQSSGNNCSKTLILLCNNTFVTLSIGLKRTE